MGQLGVLFSLDEKTVKKLKSIKSDEKRLEYVEEEIEEYCFENHPELVAELDKSWDTLHRCLTDGALQWNNGTFPSNHVILGGELLYHQEDYIMSLKTPAQVTEIAQKIRSITKEELQKKYLAIPEQNYGSPLSYEDFEYTWEWFESSKPFWAKAALENRYVLFTVDQ